MICSSCSFDILYVITLGYIIGGRGEKASQNTVGVWGETSAIQKPAKPGTGLLRLVAWNLCLSL